MLHLHQGALWQLVPEMLRPGTPLLAAVLILVGSWYGAKLVSRLIKPQFVKQIPRVSVAETLLGVFRAIVMVIALFTVANVLGYEPENVLLSVTVLTAAIAYILAPLLGSLINGLFVLVNRPYEVGDLIELEDADRLGYIREITLRYTKIHTLENTTLLIPNDSIHSRDVVNYSEDDERSWHSVSFTVTYESDLEAAIEDTETAVSNIDAVVDGGPSIRMGGNRYPAAPTAFVTKFGERGAEIELRFWVFEPYHLKGVRSQVLRVLNAAFDDSDLSLAYPRTHHVFDETSGRASVSFNGSTPPWPDQVEHPDRRPQ